MWVRFLERTRWKATPQAMIRYDKDQVVNIPADAAQLFIASGKAVAVKAKSNGKNSRAAETEPEAGQAPQGGDGGNPVGDGQGGGSDDGDDALAGSEGQS